MKSELYMKPWQIVLFIFSSFLGRKRPGKPSTGRRWNRLEARRLPRAFLTGIPIALLCFSAAYASEPATRKTSVPEKEGSRAFLHDHAGIVEEEQRRKIEEFLRNRSEVHETECIIVIINSDGTDPLPVIIDSLIKYEIGQQTDKALLILLLNGKIFLAPSVNMIEDIRERYQTDRNEVLSLLSEGKTGEGLMILLRTLFPDSKHGSETSKDSPSS